VRIVEVVVDGKVVIGSEREAGQKGEVGSKTSEGSG